jgi:hypothetical protein
MESGIELRAADQISVTQIAADFCPPEHYERAELLGILQAARCSVFCKLIIGLHKTNPISSITRANLI